MWYVWTKDFKECDMKGGCGMNKRLVRFTKWLLDGCHVLWGMVSTLGFRDIPLCGKIYLPIFRVHYHPSACFIGSGIPALIMIVRELRRMFGTVLADDAFVMENADSLKRTEMQLFLAFISLNSSRLHRGLAVVYHYCVFIAGLFCFVLYQVFERPYGTKRKMT